MPLASQVVEKAVSDESEGAEERKKADAFGWTQIDAGEYNQAFEEGIGATVLEQGQTIREGMLKTGGYVGTDLDQQLNKIEDNSQIDISDQIASLHGDQNLIMTQTLVEARLSLKQLRKHRRKLREKLLCQTNCKFDQWSFLYGIKLTKQCPIDCPIRQELEGTRRGKTSIEAMEAYQSQPQTNDSVSNRQLLAQTDKEIDKLEKLVGSVSKVKKAQRHKKQHKAAKEKVEVSQPTENATPSSLSQISKSKAQ